MLHGLQRIYVITLIIFISVTAVSSHAQDVRYWVWQRNDPLEEQEVMELGAQKIDTIYWQIGELENVGETWRWKVRFALPSANTAGVRFVPVVRLISHEHQPFSDASVATLLPILARAGAEHDELQLDYDAPDRLLPDYAMALKRIHGLVSRLTIAALPHWSRVDYLKTLEPSVDELLPMLYDFEAEPILTDRSPLPLIAPEKISKLIEGWRACRKPWRAGLPVFARLSVYDANQKLRGQIRNWNWDELCFNRSFQFVKGGQFATTILRATTATSIANTAINPAEEMIVRQVDRRELRHAIAAAMRAGAQGIVFFRLPDSTASSGWSLNQIAHLEAGPLLVLGRPADSETLELSNTGYGDLAPRLPISEKAEGGYILEIDAAAPIFREAEPGDFVSVAAFAGQKPARVPFASRLKFLFAQLRAKENLRTGLIQLAPGADFRQIRYRVLNTEDNPTWKPLE
jgi:hypothetical protein